ncbi:MAG: hypothetical protein LBN27_12115 [Prevotellaceae bacterium]|jgi:hypothetical protein|nr:hypothetical protein [Prevotellaceae bacterium]
MQTQENFTRYEIAHYVTLFFYNWEQDDFRAIYKGSRIGEDYVWNKLQGKIKNQEMDSTAAMLDVFLNLDSINQKLLVDYVLDKHYTESIMKQREWQGLIEAVERGEVIGEKSCEEYN